MAHNPRSKAAIVLKLLEEGDTMLCMDARYEGVIVPREHAHSPSLRLILNLNFPQPIDVTAEGISANLAFGGRRFACYIPMAALWAAFNPQTMQGMMWPDSMPPEVHAELATQQDPETAAPQAVRPVPSRKGAGPEKQNKDEKGGERPATRQRGHLRVVK